MSNNLFSIWIKGLLFWGLLISGSKADATHIVGGELNYTHLVGNSYKITFDYFIDCQNGNPGAISEDLYGSFGIFDGNTNARIPTLDRLIQRGSPTRVSETNYKCIITKPNACVDRYQYTFTLDLPPIIGGYIIAFQRCCRNNSISNLFQPGDQGSTFWTKIENLTAQKWTNSSAAFKKLPPNFLCTNAPLVFDHSAYDPDGDSLVYELFKPYDSYIGSTGARPSNPKPQPVAFLAPPFTSVTWAAGYSDSKQIDVTNNVILDPITGLLNFTPTKAGQFVVGILVKEYRNGILIGTTRRDYQFNVSNCVFEVVSSFYSPTKSCDLSVQFNNQSSGSNLIYNWDFGETDDNSDKSTETFPSYTYQKSGTYQITLIAKTSTCSDTYSRVLKIVDPERPKLGPDQKVCGNFTKILDANINSNSIVWNTGETGRTITVNKRGEYIATYQKEGCSFSDSVIIDADTDVPKLPNDTVFCNNSPFSYLLNPGHQFIEYKWNTGQTTAGIFADKPQKYVVTVKSVYGCIFTDSITLDQQLPPSVTIYDVTVCPSQTGRFTVDNSSLEYVWSTGETASSISVSIPGPYQVRVFDGKCFAKDSANLYNYPIPPHSLPADTTFCDKVYMKLTAGDNFAQYSWNTGESSQSILVEDRGFYKVSLTTKDGCNTGDSLTIGLNPLPYISFGNDTTICEATILELNAGEGVSYLWQDGSTTRTKFTYDSGLYYVHVTDINGCVNGDSIRIYKDPNALPSDLYMPNAFSPNADGLNDVYPNNQFKDIGVEYNLKIFTRWGEKLEDYNSPSSNWDGIYKGEAMAEGVYIYLINWIGCDNVRRSKSGNVTLLK